MSRSEPISARAGHALGLKGIKFNWDWVTRPVFGITLAATAVAAIVGGAPYLALLVAIGGIAAAREWHRMIGERVFGPMFFLSAVAIAAALVVEVFWPHGYAAWAILAAGAVLIAAYASANGQPPAWHAFGLLYIGVTALCVILLRGAPAGPAMIVGMFVAIWATDTGALVIGNLIGGPRLWPVLSPNKTWAGTLGGIAAAAAVEALYIGVLHGHVVPAALFGAAVAVVAHCGDLFESKVKRQFQRKDSGALIPGHGGVLDRIDSTLFVAPALTAVVILTGFSPMFGAHT